MPAENSAAPGRSRRGRTPSRLSGRMNTSAQIASTGAMITLMRSAHRHEYTVVRNPPTNGPKATAAPAAAPQAANAFARSAPTNVVEMIDSVAGNINDAPIPSISASPTKSVGTDVEIDASPDPNAKISAPMTKVRRCP